MSEWDDAVAQLTEDDWDNIQALNARIQSHTGSWGRFEGGNQVRPGVFRMPSARPDPLIEEFVALWYRLNLVLPFNWGGWDKGRELFASSDSTRYDKLDKQTTLKLLTALIRSDRFTAGALLGAFESGDMPKILDRFVSLRNQ